ncbi:hypothetical protein BJF85_13090 [Saccharomonospora sp. CUA-673]|uniref:YciC family protein n=1 Tax=Saccharomonospora sp. CUA-673 TaxID=1904969 RepID=UPI0009641B0B|nr:YciC family protein [Saccharomonospora sp. CUA-673]OLT48180.1 hypothetical protein BJF85_13090 [Saccharomonospora sp. CUA-673]
MSDSDLPRYPSQGGGFQGEQPGVIPLRPLGLGEIFEGAWNTMRRYAGVVFGTSAAVAFVGAVAMFLANLYLLPDVQQIDPNASVEQQAEQAQQMLADTLPANGTLLLVSLLTQTLVTGLLVVIIGRAVLGKPITFAEAWAEFQPRLPAVLGLTVLVSLITMVGTFLLIIPGIVAYVFLALATPALVLERGTIGAAMKRSFNLVSGSWWRVFGILLLALVITTVVGMFIQMFFTMMLPADGELSTGQQFMSELGYGIAQAVTVPFAAGVAAILYMDQRIRRENLGEELKRAAQLPD